jgi:hypothetical protein
MKFRISDLLWLMSAAAIVAGLWVYQQREPPPRQNQALQVRVVEVHVADVEPLPRRVTFDDLNLGMGPDEVFGSDRLKRKHKELIGQRISIKGIIHSPPAEPTKIVWFILERNAGAKYPRPADELLEVSLRKGTSVSYTRKHVLVEGILRVEPKKGDGGFTLSVYQLEDATVKTEQ